MKQVSTNGGLAVVTAGGKVLGNGETTPVADILKNWRALPEEERRPGAVQLSELAPDAPRAQTPVPLPPKALVLKAFIRPVEHQPSGEITALPLDTLACGWASYDVPREGAWVMALEWKALVPAEPRKGKAIQVPRSLRERLLRFHLADWYRYGGPWPVHEIRAAELTGTVEEVRGSQVRIRLQGKALIANDADVAKASRGYEGTLHGLLIYDRAEKAFSRFDLLAIGDAWWTDTPQGFPEVLKKNLGRHTIAMAFELAPAGTGFALLPPRYLGGDGGDRGYRNWLQEYLAVE